MKMLNPHIFKCRLATSDVADRSEMSGVLSCLSCGSISNEFM